MKSFFETLVDLDDYFEDEGSVADAFGDESGFADFDEGSTGTAFGEEYTPPEPEPERPLAEPEYKEVPQVKQIEEMVQKADEPSQELIKRAEDAAKRDGEFGLKKFFDDLSEKEKNSMLRYSLAAMGMGASQALRALQQRNEQQFMREQSDIAYQRRREEEDRAREERRIAGTPQAYQFNMTPRGIIGGGMGG